MNGADIAAAVAATDRVLSRTRPDHVPVDPQTVLDEADVQSLVLMEILVELEDLTGAAVVTDVLSEVRTVADIAALPRVRI